MIFNTTVSSKHPAVTQDAQGTDVENFTTGRRVDRRVPASVQQLSAHEVQKFQRRGFEADYVVFTRNPLAAGKGDQLTNDLTGEVFEVQIPANDMAGRGLMSSTIVKLLGTDA